MPNKNHRSLIIFLGGMAGGIFLSILLGIGFFYAHTIQTVQSSYLPIIQPENTFQSPMTIPSQSNLFDEAEAALDSGQPEKVRELLYPMIDNWTTNQEFIRGYKLLGEAELAQGHAQLAVPYFEKLYFYEPNPENLYLLATVYDAGGNIKIALAKYQELAKWENHPPEVDIEFVNLRIYDISRALGTPVPTHTPLP